MPSSSCKYLCLLWVNPPIVENILEPLQITARATNLQYEGMSLLPRSVFCILQTLKKQKNKKKKNWSQGTRLTYRHANSRRYMEPRPPPSGVAVKLALGRIRQTPRVFPQSTFKPESWKVPCSNHANYFLRTPICANASPVDTELFQTGSNKLVHRVLSYLSKFD